MSVIEKSLDKSDHPEYQMAALLVKGGNVISRATNRSHPSRWLIRNYIGHPCGRHAEANVLWGLNREATAGAVLYVTGRVKKSRRPITSRPCPACFWFAKRMGIKRIVWITDVSGSLASTAI